MTWVLLAIVLNAQTGEPVKFETLRSFDEPAACVRAAVEQGPQKVTDGTVRVFLCARDRAATAI